MGDPIDHLPYELDMLYGTYVGFPNVDPLDTVMRNAAIESFCIHARLLFEFFHKQSRKQDYTVGYKPRQSLTHYSKILNHQIAHLGRLRTHIAADKIDGAIREDMLNRLRTEVVNFKSCMKDAAKVATIPDIPATSLTFYGKTPMNIATNTTQPTTLTSGSPAKP